VPGATIENNAGAIIENNARAVIEEQLPSDRAAIFTRHSAQAKRKAESIHKKIVQPRNQKVKPLVERLAWATLKYTEKKQKLKNIGFDLPVSIRSKQAIFDLR